MRAAIIVILVAIAGVAHADDADELALFAKAGVACEKTRAHCFGLQLHVAHAEGDAGGFVVTPAWVSEQLANAQKHFLPLDTGYEVVGVDDKSVAHVVTREDRDALAAKGLTGPVVDVYFIAKLEDVDHPGDPVFGVTWHTKQGRKYIIVSSPSYPRTLAHELGHFFGLPHSTYAISIMNKTPRKTPALEDRRFHDNEIAAMKPVLKQLVRDKIIVERPKP